MQTWKASLYEQRPYVDDFRSFQASGGEAESPLQWSDLPDLPKAQEDSFTAVDADCLKTWTTLLVDADAALLSPQV